MFPFCFGFVLTLLLASVLCELRSDISCDFNEPDSFCNYHIEQGAHDNVWRIVNGNQRVSRKMDGPLRGVDASGKNSLYDIPFSTVLAAALP